MPKHPGGSSHEESSHEESSHGSHMGGDPAPTGDGGNIHYPKNDGTSDDKTGGTPSEKMDKSGLNVSIGKG